MTPRRRVRASLPRLLAASGLALLYAVQATTGLAAADSGISARAEFRPLGRSDVSTPAMRRPAQRAAAADWRVRMPDVTSPRSGLRKAVPITRGQELGMRFRPDERDPLYGSGLPASPTPGAVTGPDTDQAFRPIPRRTRPTYEALEAERRAKEAMAAPPMPAPMTYPGLPAPPVLPPLGRSWPRF